MVSIPAAVAVAVSVYILLVTVVMLYLTYVSTKQDYTVNKKEEAAT